MKSYLFILPLGIMFLLGSCTGRNQIADATGTFEATEIIVSAEATGKIMALNITEGQILQSGQEAGYIDSVQLYLKKMQLLASQGAVKSRRPEVSKQIAVINQQIETAIVERKRIENLLKSEAANRKQLDDINAQIAVLEKQLTALKSNLDITNRGITEEASVIDIQVAQLDDQLRKCTVTSPISGTVLMKYAEEGELATMGKPLFKIADMENIFLRAYITSSQLSRVKLGQQVKLLADEGEKNFREYKGVIAWISDKAEFTPKTIQTRDERANLVYAVKISVKNDGYLKLGMYGQIELPSAE